MAKQEKVHEPVTIALVRDISQRGHYSEVRDPLVREDGWLRDPQTSRWFSPDNVINVTTFTPRKWDGNGIQPGTLCAWRVWKGVTSERPTGYEDETVVVLNRNAAKKCYTVVMPDGQRKLLPEGKIVPLLEPQNAPT
jgi:hypothetical protein